MCFSKDLYGKQVYFIDNKPFTRYGAVVGADGLFYSIDNDAKVLFPLLYKGFF